MIHRVIAFCVGRPWLVIGVAVALAGLGGFVTATRFRINTDTERLISPNEPWRQNEAALERYFPQRTNLIVVVMDADSPERADEAAELLTQGLQRHPDRFTSVRRPDGGAFFEKNGLLFLSTDDLTATTEQLIQQQGLLGPLAADPSLRGVMQSLSLGAQGVRAQQTTLDELAGPMEAFRTVFERAVAGQPARLSWQMLMSGGKAKPGELRRLVLVQPQLDYAALQPGARAIALVRQTADELGLTADRGVKVRLTGLVPIETDEFGTLKENAGLNAAITIAAIILILYLALRSGRVIVAVLATTLVGLVVTTGLGLLMVGAFNPISIAFAALFLGLGIDFAIQVAVRYRAERYARKDLRVSIIAAGRAVGWSLTLAALSLLAGFFSFLPTAFRGVSELGLIAGVGMIVAYVASLTLLPALLAVLHPPGERETVETASLAAVDRWIAGHRALILIITAAVVLAGTPLLTKLSFDANPMNLRSRKVESVATYIDLARDPQTTPNTVHILAPSLDAATALAQELDKLPEVGRTVTLASFIPQDQEEKLAIIHDAAMLLDPVLRPSEVKPPPTDAENIQALRATAAALRDVAGSQSGPAEDTARRLAEVLDRLADAAPDRRAAAQTAVTIDLVRFLGRLRTAMTAEPVTRETLPADLVRDWVAPDGHARIEAAPEGDSTDDAVLERFATAVLTVAPNATGGPVVIYEAGRTVVRAFIEAGLFSLIAIFLILVLALRHPIDVALTLGPLVLATIMTLEAAYLLGLNLNYANIIALPLILAIGVAFHIYYIVAWRAGIVDLLASSLTRAIFFSAMTTGVAFGSLCFSSHPGTASMGQLLALSLVFTLLAAFVIVPAFLGPPRQTRGVKRAVTEPKLKKPA